MLRGRFLLIGERVGPSHCNRPYRHISLPNPHSLLLPPLPSYDGVMSPTVSCAPSVRSSALIARRCRPPCLLWTARAPIKVSPESPSDYSPTAKICLILPTLTFYIFAWRPWKSFDGLSSPGVLPSAPPSHRPHCHLSPLPADLLLWSCGSFSPLLPSALWPHARRWLPLALTSVVVVALS